MYFLGMFLRKKSNKSGSVSVQIVSYHRGKYTVEQTIGSSINEQELQKLWFVGKQEIVHPTILYQIIQKNF